MRVLPNVRARTVAGSLILAAVFFVLGIYVGARQSLYEYSQAFTHYKVSNTLYRWYKLKRIAAKEVIHSADNPLTCPLEYKAIALFGQSNSANRINRPQGLKRIDDGKTFMWDWSTRRCYSYREPVVGTDGDGMGNIITGAILDVRKQDQYTNLIIVAFGYGGTSVFTWSHGYESIRLDEVLSGLKAARIEPSLFLWHQGESDAMEEIYFPEKVSAYGLEIAPKKKFYSMALDMIVNKVHSAFPNARFGIAIASICQNNGSDEVRAAQRAVQQRYAWTVLSSDTDALGSEYRSADCHFNEKGESSIASDYAKVILQSIGP